MSEVSASEPAPGSGGVKARHGRGWVGRIGVALFALVLVSGVGALVCRAVIGWVFPVGSESMEPAIMTGESVFLRYGKKIGRRFDVVAFKDPAGGASIKRAAALPDERVMVNASGDLLINGAFLPVEPGRPEPVPIFDSKLQSIADHWRHGGTAFDPWAWEPGAAPGESDVYTLDGDAVQRGSDLGLLRFQDRVTDGYLTNEGQCVQGSNVVHDIIVEFEVKVLSAGGVIRVQISEESDWFAAYLPVYSGEGVSTMLLKRIRPSRFGDEGPDSFLGSLDTRIPLGEWVRIRLANIDNHVYLSVGDATCTGKYARNTPRLNPMGFPEAPFSAGERVKLGGNGLDLQVRNVRVLRDYYILPRGDFGVGRELLLGSDEFFVLGDNTVRSRDSRDRGPIPLERLIGTAKAVVRPLGGFRKL